MPGPTRTSTRVRRPTQPYDPSHHAKPATTSKRTSRTSRAAIPSSGNEEEEDAVLPKHEDEAESTDGEGSDEDAEMDFDAMDVGEDEPAFYEDDDGAGHDDVGHQTITNVPVNNDQQHRALSTCSSLTSLSSTSSTPCEPTPTTPAALPPAPPTAIAPPPPPPLPAAVDLAFPTTIGDTLHVIVRMGLHAWNLIRGEYNRYRDERLAAAEAEVERLQAALAAAKVQKKIDADNVAAYARGNKDLALARDDALRKVEKEDKKRGRL